MIMLNNRSLVLEDNDQQKLIMKMSESEFYLFLYKI